MYTLEDFQKMIASERKRVEQLEKDLVISKATIIAYENLINAGKDRQKNATNDDIIKYAHKVIKENTDMHKTNKIVNAMASDGYIVNGPDVKWILLKSGKFRINSESKVWEIIE